MRFWATCRVWCRRVKRKRPSWLTTAAAPPDGGFAKQVVGAEPVLALAVCPLLLAALFVLLCGVGISRVQLLDSRGRQLVAGYAFEYAAPEQEAKRVNDANQAAICG